MDNNNELPSHGSPLISPIPRPSSQYLTGWADFENTSQPGTPGIPHNLISPAFTPPLTPSIPGTPSGLHHGLHRSHEPRSIPVDTSLDDPTTTRQPRLLQRLPQVECLVRARIPTTSGAEMFLHLYQNDSDNKEHLAIVFGNSIRSRSLDAEKAGETEMDRMIRGAYVGRLRPGRTSSRKDEEDDLRRKVLRMEIKNRPRSGSALKNVHTIPEDAAVTTQPATPASTSTAPSEPQRPSETSSEPSASNTDPTTSATANEEESSQPQSDTPTNPSLLESTLSPLKPPLVRIHSECYTGETAWSARCDCGEQLDEAARLMSTVSSTNPDPASIGGVIVYLRQEGRGIGLASKLKAYNLQDLGNDTVEANLLLRHPADARTYGLATAILQDLGLGTDEDTHKDERCRGIRLLTNNPDKVRAVEGPNKEVRVVERVAMVPLAWSSGGREGVKGAEIEKYLETKIGRMGHMLQH